MTRHIKWPSIEQFRSVVHNVQHGAHYVGKDADGNAIINTSRGSPTLKFEGTIKLHGTNASVVISPKCEMWFQSRENIITPEKDNAGFAMFAYQHEQVWQDIATDVTVQFDAVFTGDRDLVIFGEWCAGSIQKGVALNQLPKMFVIFGIAFVDTEGIKTYLSRNQMQEVLSSYVSVPVDNVDDSRKIYSIYDFPTYEIEIDFNRPHDAQNKLQELTLAVEIECPVGKAFGVSGVGEGVVWKCVNENYLDSGYWFKVKGDAHSKGSKVKTLAAVDVERIDNINELAKQLTPAWRLEQMVVETFDTLNGGEIVIERMGAYIKDVMKDILKEELDTLAASGFTTKDVTGAVSKIAREYLMEQLNDLTR